eukprot:89431_1
MENQLLIKFTDDKLCEQISQGIDSGKLPIINLRPVKLKNESKSNHNKPSDDESEYQREFELHIPGDNTIYKTKLMDLPCIIESQKTYNKNLYFKTGDISQMLVVENTDTEQHGHGQYILDSGITPPSSDIRERWSHARPICHHDDVDINDYCSKCHNIPRGLIQKVSKEIHDRMHGQASELWEIVTTEEWIEVTDDESEDEMKLDRKLRNSHAINEWEESEDEDDDIKMNQNTNNKDSIKRESVKREEIKDEKRNTNKKHTQIKKENSMTRVRPSSSTRSPRPSTNASSKALMSNTRSVSRPIASAQPPLPLFSSQRRSTPRRTTPRRNTPLISTLSASSSNLIKVHTKQSSGNDKRKKMNEKNDQQKKELEQRLKTKQSELNKLEEKFKKQKNRKMKKKTGQSIAALKKEMEGMQSKLKSL